MNLRFEWLENGVSEIGNSNWFPSKFRYSSEVKLARLGPILPIKWFSERCKDRSDVMLIKDEGSCPTNSLRVRFNSSSFLSLYQSEKWKVDKNFTLKGRHIIVCSNNWNDENNYLQLEGYHLSDIQT